MVSKHVVRGLLGAVIVLAAAGPPASAQTLVPARELGPSRGGAAKAPYGYIPLHARELARAKAAASSRAAAQAGKGGGKPGGKGGGGPTVTSYANVSPSFAGVYQSGLTPPDSTGAIGPDRYIETVNTQYTIRTRSGSAINSGSLSSLTGISGGLFGYTLSDPQMMWDAETQRFYYSAVYYDAFLSDNGLAVGWSKTATPTSASDFCQYAISFGGELPDYPKLGDSADFLLFGYNAFGTFASVYDGSGFAILNKPPAGSACAPTSAFTVHTSGALSNANGTPAATPVPANLVDDSNGAGYVVANADLTTAPSADFVSVYTVTTDGADANGIPIPHVSAAPSVPVASYELPANAPEKGSSYVLDTLDGRFEAAVAAVDPGHGDKLAIWTAHAVFGGAGAEERWYEIDPAGGSLLQHGVATDSALYVWNGAIAPDRANTGAVATFGSSMAMSVSTSSTAAYPALQLVWKKGAGAQSALTNLVQSAGPSIDFSCSSTTPCRWGDYSGASPDPAATGTAGKVWIANQYNVTGGSTGSSSTVWRTWVAGVTPTG